MPAYQPPWLKVRKRRKQSKREAHLARVRDITTAFDELVYGAPLEPLAPGMGRAPISVEGVGPEAIARLRVLGIDIRGADEAVPRFKRAPAWNSSPEPKAPLPDAAAFRERLDGAYLARADRFARRFLSPRHRRDPS